MLLTILTGKRLLQVRTPLSLETQGLLVGTMQYFWASNILGPKFTSPALEVNFHLKISHRPDKHSLGLSGWTSSNRPLQKRETTGKEDGCFPFV